MRFLNIILLSLIITILTEDFAASYIYSTECTSERPCTFFAVSDQDTNSRVPHSSGNTVFESHLLLGEFSFNHERQQFTFHTNEPKQLYSHYNELGRGMELSELIIWNNTLIAFDDRTGIAYEIKIKKGLDTVSICDYYSENTFTNKSSHLTQMQNSEFIAIPRMLVTESEHSPKGFKIEWATVRDDEVFIGSFGKEHFNVQTNSITNYNHCNIIISKDLHNFKRVDWRNVYNLLRQHTKTTFPGYLIHEAVLYREASKEWFFLPRRVSTEMYNAELDEQRGASLIIILSKDKRVKTINLKFRSNNKLRGFSTATFLPGSNDELILAVRTEEIEKKQHLASYVSIFSIHGKILMDEILLSDSLKIEGIEILQASKVKL